MNDQFFVASARGSEPDALVAELISSFDKASVRANFGFLYATDSLVPVLSELIEKTAWAFDVRDWVGTVGLGICCTGTEIYEQPAVVVMLARFGHFQLFQFSSESVSDNDVLSSTNLDACNPSLAIIHGDPTQVGFSDVFDQLCSARPNTFFVGGLASSRSSSPLILNGVVDSTAAGVLFEDSSRMLVAHTQGCTPLENRHEITKSSKNLVTEIDHRPAIDVFKEDIGDVLAQELEKKEMEKIAGYIFAGFPIESSDTNDYLVRNIIGFDLDRSIIAIGDYVEEGRSLVFCRRDGNSANQDMRRMLLSIKSRLLESPKGALYFSCLARGRNQFGEDSAELKMIQETLGDIPLVGFFANGEILHNRLYGYTGVLTIFI